MTAINRDFQQDFEDVMKDVISPIFKRMKFRKRNSNFNKTTNDIVQVFNVQKSQWNHSDRVSFTFNLGFFNEQLHRIARNKESVPEFIREYDCFLSERLGRL